MKRLSLVTFAVLLAGLLIMSRTQAGSPDDLRASAEKGDVQAQFELARAYLRGDGIAGGAGLAFEWMKKAADAGHADAIGGLGYFYSSGTAVAKDPPKAFELFKIAAEKGSAKAQLNLRRALTKGEGAPMNEEEGSKWIERAAAQGLAEAEYAQAESVFIGQNGRPVDYPRALSLALAAAKQGHAPAQNLVGVIHQHGFAGAADDTEAEKWFRRATVQGDAKTQSNLGHFLGPESPDLARRREALTWLFISEFIAPGADAAKFHPTPESARR